MKDIAWDILFDTYKDKKSEPHWKVQYVSYKKKDQRKDSKAKYPKRTTTISKSRWPSLGFHISMSVEEAKVRAKQLNAQQKLLRQEEEVLRIEREQTKYQLQHNSHLPDVSNFITFETPRVSKIG